MDKNNIFGKFIYGIVFVLVLGMGVASCSGPMETLDVNKEEKVRLKICSWNLQTFFDAVTEGTEYSEFIKSDAWGKDAYIKRLENLCYVMKELDGDVFVMEEIENEGVLNDIYNFMAGEWNVKKVYSYGAFAKDSGSSIGVALLSRYPLISVKVHKMDVRTKKMPSVRPMLEVTVLKDGKAVNIYVNHWKSMSGGEEKTEYWRNRQEGILYSLCNESAINGIPFISCGDFNRDIEKFCTDGKGNVLLREYAGGQKDSGILLKSAWFTEGGALVKPGSYYYNGEWSRIDHIFMDKKIKVLSFNAETGGNWCSLETEVPVGYKVYSGSGWSDHLPISAIVEY